MNANSFINYLNPGFIPSDPSIFYQHTGYFPPTPPLQPHYQVDDQVYQIPDHSAPLINEIKDTNYNIESNSYNMNSRQYMIPFSLPAEPMDILITPSQSTETCSTNAISLYQEFDGDFNLYPPPSGQVDETCYSQSLSTTGSGFASNSLCVMGYPSPCSSASPLSCYEPYPTSTNEYEDNKKKTNSKKPYACSLCPKTFGRKQERQRHQVCHTKERNFPCTECLKPFARRDAMQRHRKSHFKVKTKKYTTRVSKI